MKVIKHQLKHGATAAKKYYRHILSLTLVLLSVIIIYGGDFEVLANEALQNEAYSYVLLLPFFAGFLFYLKKDAVKASLLLTKHKKQAGTRYLNEIMGATLCIVAFLVYWYGSYTFYPLEYHLISLPVFIMGVTLILLNPKALQMLIFPILFLLFLVPLPTPVTYTIGGAMANLNSQVSYAIMKTAGLPVTLTTEYGAPTISLLTSAGKPTAFSVDVPCSGVYSLIAFTMFAAFLAFLASASIFKKLLMFAAGFAIFAILNIIRLVAILSIGYWLGEETALIVHSFAGLLLIFFGILIVLSLSDRILKIKILTKPQEQPPCPQCTSSSANFENFCQRCGRFLKKSNQPVSNASFAKLLILVIGCSIAVLSIRAPVFATAQGSIELSSGDNWQNATTVFPDITSYKLAFLYRDTAYEKIAHQDISLMYGYFPDNTSSSVVYADIGVSSSLSNLHNWEVCLITMQTAQGQYPLVNVRDSRDIQLLQDPPLIAQYLVFDSPDNYTQVTLYWYEKATFKTGLTVEQKYVRISLIILTQNATSYPQHEQELLAVAQQIATEWEPLKTQALISLGVPAQQSLLIACITFLAVTRTTQYLTEQRKTANNLKIFNNFASPEEKLVLQTMHELAKERKFVETSNILENVQGRTREPLDTDRVLSLLDTLEEHGLVKKDIVSVGNAPRLVWKL
jgi:exosortase